MICTLRIWIVLTVLGLAGAGAAGAYYGPQFARNMLPQFYVARAVATTANEFMPVMDSLQVLIPEIQNASQRHEFTLGLNHISGIDGIDPAILSVAPMLSLRNVLRRDMDRNAYAAAMSLQMAATTLVSADLHLDQELIAVRIPLLFDHSITANPRRIGSEWDSSILGGILASGIIDDTLFYQAYSTLFDRRPEVDLAAFMSSLVSLAANIDFYYAGQNTEMGVDVFQLTVPAGHANASANLLIADFIHFAEDLTLTMYVGGNRLSGMDFVARADIGITSPIDLHGQIRFTDIGTADFYFHSSETDIQYLETLSGHLALDVTGAGQVINFAIEANGHGDLTLAYRPNYSIGAEGAVRLFPEAWRVEADLSRLDIQIPGADISFNLRYMLMPDNEPVIFNDESAQLLTDLNIFDLLGVYARIEGSPLAGIIGDFLQ